MSCTLVFVTVLDAAKNVALDLHLFATLDETLLALPINVVDVFLGCTYEALSKMSK